MKIKSYLGYIIFNLNKKLMILEDKEIFINTYANFAIKKLITLYYGKNGKILK